MAYNRLRVESRKQFRIEVGWTGACTVGTTRVSGTILDISVGGGFLGLRAATNPDQVPAGLAIIESGEAGTLSFLMVGQEATEVAISVRWVGYSKTHGCHGIGFEFTTA